MIVTDETNWIGKIYSMVRNTAYKLCIIIFMMCAACISTPVNSSDMTSARDIEVKLKVPDMGWKIRIHAIHQRDEILIVISSLTRQPGMAGQAISTVSDKIHMPLPDLPIKHFILGKTWKWKNPEPYTFIHDMDEIAGSLEGGQLLYRRSSE